MSEQQRLTLITALYDLARRQPGSGRATVPDYLRWGERLFCTDCDIVFHVDPELESAIWERRAAHGLDGRTRVVAEALEQLPAYELLQEITAARERHPLINGDPVKDTPLHAIVEWSKFELGQRVAADSTFGGTHCAWIDLGLGKVARFDHAVEDGVFARPGDGLRLLMMKAPKQSEIADRGNYLSYLWGQFAAGYMCGAAKSFLQLCEVAVAEAAAALDEGYAASDEQLLALVQPRLDAVVCHYGDYSHILENYRWIRGSAENLLFQLRHCRSGGEWDRVRARDIAGRVVASCRAGVFKSDPRLLPDLIEECMLALYWGDYPDASAARDAAELYEDLAGTDPEFRDAFLRHEIRVRANLATVRSGQ